MGKPAISATVRGVDELHRSVDRAVDELRDLRPENADAAQIAAGQARRDAPRRTGVLVGSIRTTATPTQAIVEATAPYAAVITFGWPARNIKPNPSIIDAVHDAEPRWLDVYRKALERITSRIKGTT